MIVVVDVDEVGVVDADEEDDDEADVDEDDEWASSSFSDDWKRF